MRDGIAVRSDAHSAGDELACRELVELVTEYFERRLSEHDRLRFERHLLGCEGCRNYVEQMRYTIESVGRASEADIPLAGREELLAAYRRWRRDRD